MSTPESGGPGGIRTLELRHVKATVTKKPLPYVQHLCRIPLNFVKVYDKRLILKASAANDGDNPELFIDLEHPHPEFIQQNGAEIHLGVSANFRLEPQRNSVVKPHVDIYIPISEVGKLIEALRSVKP